MSKAKKDLDAAKRNKKNEFYTQLEDINKEMNAYVEYNPDVFRNKTILLPCDDPVWSNFTKFFVLKFNQYGIKRIISTSFTPNGKGKIADINDVNNITPENIPWRYLTGDGDFFSEEVTRLRDEADFIITNPPFTLFRKFFKWIMESGKGFSILGNMNSSGYKEIYPYIMNNEVWYGPSISSGDREFRVPDDYPIEAAGYRVDEDGNKYLRIKGVRWYTNIEHGQRHEWLQLMTMEDNLIYSKNKEIKKYGYRHYSNYDAIHIPATNTIPSDWKGYMGVPISFLDKYNPEQFEIVKFRKGDDNKDLCVDGHCPFLRIIIKSKQ